MALALTIILVFCMLAACARADGNNAGGKARSCTDARRFYSGKGFTLNGVPNAEISGKNTTANGCGGGGGGFTAGARHLKTHINASCLWGTSAPAGRVLAGHHGDILTAYCCTKQCGKAQC